MALFGRLRQQAKKIQNTVKNSVNKIINKIKTPIVNRQQAKQAEKEEAKRIQEEKERQEQQRKEQEYFEKRRREQDLIEQEQLRASQELQRKFSIAELTLQMVESAINDVARDHEKAGQHLRNLLSREISNYGRESVVRTIAQAPEEFVEMADISLRYNPGDNRHDNSIRELEMIILGHIPDAKEAQELQHAIDLDIYE